MQVSGHCPPCHSNRGKLTVAEVESTLQHPVKLLQVGLRYRPTCSITVSLGHEPPKHPPLLLPMVTVPSSSITEPEVRLALSHDPADVLHSWLAMVPPYSTCGCCVKLSTSPTTVNPPVADAAWRPSLSLTCTHSPLVHVPRVHPCLLLLLSGLHYTPPACDRLVLHA